MRLRKRSAQGGATLVEVLVAMLLLSAGLLAMANLQRASMRASSSAAHAVAASQIALDLAEKVHAFPAAAGAGAFDGITTNRSGDMEVHLDSDPASKNHMTIRIVWTDPIGGIVKAPPSNPSSTGGGGIASAAPTPSSKRSSILEFAK